MGLVLVCVGGEKMEYLRVEGLESYWIWKFSIGW